MACISPGNLRVFVPEYEITPDDKITKYIIKMEVGHIHWIVSHRYSAFAELHESLISNHGLAKDLIPPKKLIGNKNIEFIKTRQKGLQDYLQKVVNFLSFVLPEQLVDFLQLKEYETTYLLHDMAKNLIKQEELLQEKESSLTLSPLQLMAISLQLRSPTASPLEPNCNFANLVDFCSTLNHLTIEGNSEKYKSSNIVLNELPYTLNVFKNLYTVNVSNANILKIERLGNLRTSVKKIKIRNSKLQQLTSLLLCDFIHKNLDETDERCHWTNLLHLNLSSNEIEAIDESICLVPNIQTLIIKSNKLTDIGTNLKKLPHLVSVNLCNNQICHLEDLHTKLGNVKILNLSQNNLTTLEGFSKLYSVVTLNVSSNCLKTVKDVEHIRHLPCLEELVLTGNQVSTVVDYRAKILELFGKKAWELCLDNEKSTQKELDKVAVLQALRTAREGRLPTFPLSHPMPSSTLLLCERPDMGSIARE